MDIQQSWSEFFDRPFPDGWAGEEVNGVCVTSVDSFAAGCIDTFLSNGGTLDSHRIDVLRRCATDLARVLPQLDDEVRDYFGHLNDLITAVLKNLER